MMCCFSIGRDKVIMFWDTAREELLQTVVALESLEDLIMLPTNAEFPNINVTSTSQHFITSGQDGE